MRRLEDTMGEEDLHEVVGPSIIPLKTKIRNLLHPIDDEFRRILGSYPAEDLDTIFDEIRVKDVIGLAMIDQPFLYRINKIMPADAGSRKKIRRALSKVDDISGVSVYEARLAFLEKVLELEKKARVTGYPFHHASTTVFDGSFLRDEKDAEAINNAFAPERKEFPAWMKYFEALWSQPGTAGSMPYE
jgi:hypothetical protein